MKSIITKPFEKNVLNEFVYKDFHQHLNCDKVKKI